MLVVGIDENGLGPQLGPLVVTGTFLEVENPDELLTDILRESKQVFTSGIRMEEGETIVLSFYQSMEGYMPSSSSSLLDSLLLPLEDTCRQPLPHCSPQFELPHWTSSSSINSSIAFFFLDKVRSSLRGVKSVALCPAQLNKRLRSFSKNQIDYLLFEELMMFFKKMAGEEEILFLCGGIGRTRNYAGFFHLLSSHSYKVRENDEEVRYIFPHWGEVRFVENGDEKYFPIALASLFGKYIRELYIEQMNSFFRSHLPSLPRCSGYRDPKTAQFLRETEDLRRKLNISEECFLREK